MLQSLSMIGIVLTKLRHWQLPKPKCNQKSFSNVFKQVLRSNNLWSCGCLWGM